MYKGIVKSTKTTKKNVSGYRDWLREYTGREDTPIKHTKVQGYVSEFKTEYPNFYLKEKRHKENDEFDDGANDQEKWKNIKEY
jgi:glutaredoxin 2